MMNKNRLAFAILIGGLLISQLAYSELRDPTRPPANFNGETPVSTNMFVLNATIVGRDHKLAVINGLNKKIGDEILGDYVTDIHESTVQLTGPNGKITLFLIGKPIKQLPSGNREENICTDTQKESCSFR